MKRFVEGTDRGQSTLFPERLEDWIDENNPVQSSTSLLTSSIWQSWASMEWPLKIRGGRLIILRCC